MKKNIAFSLLTLLFRIVGRFVFIFILARLFSLNEFGIFSFYLTVSGIFVLYLDYGYNIKLLKEIPRSPDLTPRLVWKALSTKMFFLFLTVCGGGLTYWLYPRIFENLSSIEFISLVMFFTAGLFISLTNLFVLPFKATNRFHFESLVFGIDALFLIGTLFLLKITHYDSYLNIVYAYTFVKFIVVLLALFIYFSHFKLKIFLFRLLGEIKNILPYGIHYFIGGVYLSIDTLILKQFVSNEDLGIYQAGLRLLMGASLLIGIINSVVLPKISPLLDRKTIFFENVTSINRKVLWLAFFVSFFLFFFQQEIIEILYGEKFSALNAIFPYFILIIFLRYAGSVYGIVLTISDKQNIRAVSVLLTLFFIIIADYYAIPSFGIKGAAVVLLLAHVLLNTIYLYFVYGEYKIFFVRGKTS